MYPGRDLFHHVAIDVAPAQACVAVRGQDLKDAIVDGKEGDVERPPAKIKHQYVLLVVTPSHIDVDVDINIDLVRNGHWLLDDTLNVQPDKDPGVLHGVALGIVEVGRHHHHRPV